MICGNETALEPTAFNAAVGGILNGLRVATPRSNGYYVASKKEVISGNITVFGVAQCIETIGKNNQTTSSFLFLKNESSSKKDALIGGLFGGIGFLLLVLAVCIWFRSSRRKKMAPRGDIIEATELQGPVNYSYRDLNSATHNFSLENKLGEGGFGDVYKGVLKNGNEVAVKKLAFVQSLRAKADFESEVRIISNVHHRNLLRLLGCCSKGAELLLVYEFMPNSSLDKFLFGEKKGSLNWKQRFDIILGTARGLAYLHEEFHLRIIHRDILSLAIFCWIMISSLKLQILVWQGFFLKIGPISVPNLREHWDIQHRNMQFTDYYLRSGRRSSETKPDSDHEYLLKQAWGLYENNRHEELVDETLDRTEYETEDVRKFIEIALMCIQASAVSRPTMSEVVLLMRSKGPLDRRPSSKPIFVELDNSTSIFTDSASNATASITRLTDR
ncbi:hypothetical protein SLE2022_044130 [Rubroshorea leprosula]